MEPRNTSNFDYLPFFYSRVFSLSWQFYGDNVGEAIHFGDFSGTKFGAYWVNKGRLVGCFLESGENEEYVAIAKAIRLKPAVRDLSKLQRDGVDFVKEVSVKPLVNGSGFSLLFKKPVYIWYATSGIVVAASVAAFAYCGMILALGARGPEFDSRNAPLLFWFSCDLHCYQTNAEMKSQK
ncbi:monodehydroascorbate reductase 4, peroxisomal-like protein [Tanacetum coccineum]